MNIYLGQRLIQWLILILGITCLMQCRQVEESPLLSEEQIWLKNHNNFKDSTYEKVFQEQVQLATQEKQWNQAAISYFSKGNALDYFLQYDSLYLAQCESFYSKNHPSLADSFRVQLPYFIGSQYDFRGQQKESDVWLKKAISNSKAPSYDRYAGYAYMILSGQKRLNQLDSSQIYAFKALEVFENLKDTLNIGTLQYDLYRINTASGDDKAALNSLERMIHYAKMTNDTINLCRAYISIGLRQNRDWSANKKVNPYMDTLNQIMTKWNQPNEHFQFLNAYLQANKYISQEKMEKAKKYIAISKSMASDQSMNEQNYLEDLQIRYDYATESTIKPERFEKWLKRTIDQKDYYNVVAILSFLVDKNKADQDYQSAFEYLNKKFVYRDSLWDDEMRGNLVEFEKKYETAKKEKQIVEQRETILKRNVTIGYLGGAMALLLFSFLVYQNRRRRKAAEKEQQLQENFSQDLLQNTEDERSRIAGDLHDSVNHNLLNLKQKTEKGQHVTKKEIEDIIQQVRSISYNLYPSMFAEIGLQKSIEELCRKVMEFSDLQIVTQIDYVKTLEPKKELQIYRIVEEALNNIIKHSEATHAMISIKRDKSQVIVNVKDNGKGIDNEILSGDKITFGMSNIKQRAKSINGKINLLSDDNGTQIKLMVNT